MYFYYGKINVRRYLQIIFEFVQIIFYIVLIWQAVNTIHLVMLACVEIFILCSLRSMSLSRSVMLEKETVFYVEM